MTMMWSRKRNKRNKERLSQAQTALESSEQAMVTSTTMTSRARALAHFMEAHREENHYSERLRLAYRSERR